MNDNFSGVDFLAFEGTTFQPLKLELDGAPVGFDAGSLATLAGVDFDESVLSAQPGPLLDQDMQSEETPDTETSPILSWAESSRRELEGQYARISDDFAWAIFTATNADAQVASMPDVRSAQPDDVHALMNDPTERRTARDRAQAVATQQAAARAIDACVFALQVTECNSRAIPGFTSY